MLKAEWGAENNGKLAHLFIPSKTAALVPELAVEDLPSAELQPWFCVCSELPALGQNTLMMMIVYYRKVRLLSLDISFRFKESTFLLALV